MVGHDQILRHNIGRRCGGPCSRAGPPAEIAAKRAAMTPMRRQGTAWDVAHAAAFLASDDAGFITGISLPVDGGLSL